MRQLKFKDEPLQSAIQETVGGQREEGCGRGRLFGVGCRDGPIDSQIDRLTNRETVYYSIYD